jgi:hypothetical protein
MGRGRKVERGREGGQREEKGVRREGRNRLVGRIRKDTTYPLCKQTNCYSNKPNIAQLQSAPNPHLQSNPFEDER